MKEMHKEMVAGQKYRWRCPSNIAIVKYWGKRENQIPCNASLSMTLQSAFTEIRLEILEKKRESQIELDFYFQGEKNELFQEKMEKYLGSLSAEFPFLKEAALKIETLNSFPHSAGIASSASSYAALAVAVLDASGSGRQTFNEDFFRKASEIARRGSGSACRSLYGGFAEWGKINAISGSSDEYAVPVTHIHDNFKNFQDAILIIDSDPKKVSSSAGHSLMVDHPYAKSRFLQANKRVEAITKMLADGDLEHFVEIAESEALTLHAMMMTSREYYLLMKSGTLIAIEKIMDFRKQTKIPVCFTLDAGPNVHVLYPAAYKNKVDSFLNNMFADDVKEIIFDQMGKGPEKIESIDGKF